MLPAGKTGRIPTLPFSSHEPDVEYPTRMISGRNRAGSGKRSPPDDLRLEMALLCSIF
jgi:hypothetical protein